MSELKFDSVPDSNEQVSQKSVDVIMAELKEPFSAKDIDWRVQRSMKTSSGDKAIALAYVDARAVMDRLDEVVGADNWQDFYTRWGGDGALCTLSIRINGEWISKADGADDTDFEAIKGGLSSALKRAAVKWGIGRYLYDLKEQWVDIKPQKSSPDDMYINDKRTDIKGYWSVPKLPGWALPGAEQRGRETQSQQAISTPSAQAPATKPTPKQAKSAENSKPASEPQKKAIMAVTKVAAAKGKNIDLDSILKEMGRTKVDDLTDNDVKTLMPRLNQMLNA